MVPTCALDLVVLVAIGSTGAESAVADESDVVVRERDMSRCPLSRPYESLLDHGSM